jgi:hypothetical protein
VDVAILTRLGQLRGSTVSQLRVDNALSLVIAPESVLRIEGAFSYRYATGDERHYADDYDPANLAPALDLFGQTVMDASASETGELAIDFQGGAAIHIPPHPQFEAWILSAPGAATLVCPPGGGAPVWPTSER